MQRADTLSQCYEGCTARVAEKGKAEDVLYYIRVPFRESLTPVQPQTQEWTCGRPDLMKDQQPRRRAVERSVGCTTQRQLQRRRRWELLGMRCGRHEKPLPQPPPGPGPGQTVWRGEAVRPRGPRGDPTPSLHPSPPFFYLFIFLECLVTEKIKKKHCELLFCHQRALMFTKQWVQTKQYVVAILVVLML